MAPIPPDQRTQEQSIKERKHELFEVDQALQAPTGPRKSFQECLRETPGDPLSTPVKAMLWTVGTIVILLLIVALVTGGGQKPKPKSPNALAPTLGPRLG